jgi:hypothetical protein
VEKYKNADKQRNLRRRSGLDQLGGPKDSELLVPEDFFWTSPETPSPDLAPVQSLLAPLEIEKPDRVKDHWRQKAKRAAWEVSLPTNSKRHSNHVTPGHTLEYINQGVPAPKKKPEEFSASTKFKRRNSSSQ